MEIFKVASPDGSFQTALPGRNVLILIVFKAPPRCNFVGMIDGSVCKLCSDPLQVSAPARWREAPRDECRAAINGVAGAPGSRALICCLLKS